MSFVVRSLVALLALALCLAAPLAQAQSQAQRIVINHSGRLLDGEDHPVNGFQTITFTFYETEDTPISGEDVPFWSESYSVEVRDGIYSLVLGSTRGGKKPLEATVFPPGKTPYLGIKVGSAGEMRPRMIVGMVPLAAHALRAASLVPGAALDVKTLAVNGVPVIDAQGNWVGPVGSINADKLGGKLPADYALAADAARLTQTDTQHDAALTALRSDLSALGLAAATKTELTAAQTANEQTFATKTELTAAQTANGQTFATKSEVAALQKPLAGACPVGQYLRGFAADGAPKCSILACPRNKADCDESVSNGCETAITTVQNCGGCGVACQTGQYCSDGVCLTVDSTIISGTQADQINQWIGYTTSTAWTSCYRLSRDGGSASTFHNLCNNKGENFFVARLSGGQVIGGYTSLSWQSSQGYRSDARAFLFSLTNNFKHAQLSSGNAIYDYSVYGPTFGNGHDFQTNLQGSQYCGLGNAYQCRVGSSTTCYNDFCGSYNGFSITELEVFVRR